MAKKGDILSKYINEYPDFYKTSNNRLTDLQRSFSNEKSLYREKLNQMQNELENAQDKHFSLLIDFNHDHAAKIELINEEYRRLSNEFNIDFDSAQNSLNDNIDEEKELYDDILEQFEEKKQNAHSIYIELTKSNNDEIDKDMRIHHDFITKEHSRLLLFKKQYEEINAELSNKMMWTIEKSRNSITQLENDLEDMNKDDLFSSNHKIAESLSDLRGVRNEVNSLFKETSTFLNDYKEEVYKLRKSKQRPYADLNQIIIQKLVKQIRLANDNKTKYQSIIKADLIKSKRVLHNRILEADNSKNLDNLEKYILQVQALEKKAEFLINRIEKITNYNLATYQNKIKEIKLEAFTRNEEIKFTYSTPVNYIENAIDIYSNYNFYFNQGFNDLDNLFSNLFSFSQSFNSIREKESKSNKDYAVNYQTNLLIKTTEISKKLSDLLYNIDDISYQIITLESRHRLNIAEIQKRIVNLDIKGDYQKFLESLDADFKVANKQFENRLKSINIKKLYQENLLGMYKTAMNLNKELELNHLEQAYNKQLNTYEKDIHKDYYDFLLSQLNQFYTSEANLSEIFMKLMKEKLVQDTKEINFQLAKEYFYQKNSTDQLLKSKENTLIEFFTTMKNHLSLNVQQNDKINEYLQERAKPYSLLTHFEKTRLYLHRNLEAANEDKTTTVCQKIITSSSEKNKVKQTYSQQVASIISFFNDKFNKLNEDNLDSILTLEDYKDVLSIITIIYFDVQNYVYKFHGASEIETLNDYYDDLTYRLTEETIKVIDKLATDRSVDKKTKRLSRFFIYAVDELEKMHLQFNSILDKVSTRYNKPYIKQIANQHLELLNQKKIIDTDFDRLAQKSLRLQNKITAQQALLNKLADNYNNYILDKVFKYNTFYLKLKNKHDKNINKIYKYVEKNVIANDKKLKRTLHLVDGLIYQNYQVLLKEYKSEKNTISLINQKITRDAIVENQFIDFTFSKFEATIYQTKIQLEKELDLLPVEKQYRLANIDVDNRDTFMKHRNILLKTLLDIEKEKFTRIPILEDEIEIENKALSINFDQLYNEHKALEAQYMAQYIEDNKVLVNHHSNSMSDALKAKWNYNSKLNQPFNDLSTSQKSLIQKTNIIQKEITHKSKQTIQTIREEREKSNNKQKRIINS